jgi:hypothetical protein
MQTLYRYIVDNEIGTVYLCLCFVVCVNLKSEGVCGINHKWNVEYLCMHFWSPGLREIRVE